MPNFEAEVPKAYRAFAKDFHEAENGTVKKPRPGEMKALAQSLEAAELGSLEVNIGGKLVQREGETMEVE